MPTGSRPRVAHQLRGQAIRLAARSIFKIMRLSMVKTHTQTRRDDLSLFDLLEVGLGFPVDRGGRPFRGSPAANIRSTPRHAIASR